MNVSIEFLDWDTAEVSVERCGHIVTKTAKLGDCEIACAKDAEQQSQWFSIAIARKLREADRDIAFKLHGMDFRKHCHFTSNFWGAPTNAEASGIGWDLWR